MVFTGHGDDEYMAQVDINLNSGADGAIYFRYLDPDNWYRAVIKTTGSLLFRCGWISVVAASSVTFSE